VEAQPVKALHLVAKLLALPYILRKAVKPDGAAYR
jgi:hypothetical protein